MNLLMASKDMAALSVDKMRHGLVVSRTEDVALVRSVIGHPGVRKFLLDDNEEVAVPLHPSIYYLSVRQAQFMDGAVADALIGVVAFIPVNTITWNPHIGILPEHQGCGLGTFAMREAVAWMFANTPCRKVVAYPPAFNGAMVSVFKKCGFRIEGHSPDSFLWHGKIHDRLLMGIEKGIQ